MTPHALAKRLAEDPSLSEEFLQAILTRRACIAENNRREGFLERLCDHTGRGNNDAIERCHLDALIYAFSSDESLWLEFRQIVRDDYEVRYREMHEAHSEGEPLPPTPEAYCV